MLDRWASKKINPLIQSLLSPLIYLKISPDLVTLLGFFLGMTGGIMIMNSQFLWGLGFLLLNRLFDGIDGALARKVKVTNAGGFLDIVLDFLFYAFIPLAFLINDPQQNGIAAGILMFSFVGTGSSFLAYSILAEKMGLDKNPDKSFFFLGGLTEGTETIIFLILFCLFPQYFFLLALVFAGLCGITILSRIYTGYFMIEGAEKERSS